MLVFEEGLVFISEDLVMLDEFISFLKVFYLMDVFLKKFWDFKIMVEGGWVYLIFWDGGEV